MLKLHRRHRDRKVERYIDAKGHLPTLLQPLLVAVRMERLKVFGRLESRRASSFGSLAQMMLQSRRCFWQR